MENTISSLSERYYESACIGGDGNITSRETFILAREIIEKVVGLNLPLSALVLLRKHSQDATEEWKKHESKFLWGAFDPVNEAKTRLFYELFEISQLDYRNEWATNKEQLKEFLKIRMEEIYLP
jgi:hypothetical protein